MKCINPYFNKKEYSGDIYLKREYFEDILQLKDSIEELLGKDSIPFLTSTDINDTNYESSIDELIDTLFEYIDKNISKNEKYLNFEFDDTVKGELGKFIRSLVMPKPLTKTEKLIQANIAGSDLITEEERREISFSKVIRSLYERSTSSLNATRLNDFDNNMTLKTIIDSSKEILITNQEELNKGIISFLTELYKILYEYLSSKYNLKEYNIPKNLYHTDNKTKIETLTKGWTNMLTLMYNVINKEKIEGTFELNIENGWTDFVFGKQNNSLYRAVNAYINLTYFDDVLLNFLGDYIQINTELDSPINYKDNKIEYRYSFAKGNKSAVKTWGKENRDAIAEMSKFSKVLINLIPVYEYDIENNTSLESFTKMNITDFVNTISKLLDLSSVITNDTIANAICLFQYNPRKSITIIFEEIFLKNNKNLIKTLYKNGFDLNFINYLYSIYATCFKGKKSWDNIELKYIRNNGVPNTYPIIDTLLGIMNSNVENNFLETNFDIEENKTKTVIKKKYNTRTTKFDIIKNVNNSIINNNNKQDILDTYELLKDGRNYTVVINISGKPVKFEFLITKNNTGILDKSSTSTNIKASNINDIDINLNDINIRRKLISGFNLSENEEKLMSILRFIDKMLYTNFSSSEEGLKRIAMLQNLSNINFKELFISAARALVVTDIYNKFENSKKEDGSEYSKLELLLFLHDKKIYDDAIESLSDFKKKLYFIQRYDGYQLNTLYVNLKWIDDLSIVEAILSGQTSKSVISNLDGDKISNFSPLFLGARLEQLITRSLEKDNATSSLLFILKKNAIKSKVINTDVITRFGIRKQIKNMTLSELLYDSIVNKFCASLTSTDKIIYTQPTTYSDKTKFLLYGISLDTLGITNIGSSNFDETIEYNLVNTVGNYYRAVWNNVLNDYKKLFKTSNLYEILNYLNNLTEEILLDKINKYNKDNKENLVFYKDTHYREISVMGKKLLSINELLYDLAFNVYTEDKIHDRLYQEKVNFLNILLENRMFFKVLKEDDNKLLSQGESDVLNKILYSLKGNNSSSWVYGSNMILAKATNKNTGKVRNVLYGKVNDDEKIELNPVLNAYFMLDNLLGNNLRLSLTGSEINHKIKTLSNILSNSNFNLFKKTIKSFNPNTKKITTFFDVQMAISNYELLTKIKAINDEKSKVLDELLIKVYKNQINEIKNKIPLSLYNKIDILLNDENLISNMSELITLYKKTIYKVENAALNALFKRNVIIPGTMRPYTPNCIYGIGPSVKVAVINDIKAKVFNFDSKFNDKIDAHDGSALESPITSILENKSLQDNEVGTIKKPIHHWYDDRFGTSTLLKYAVNTITNLWMRQSEGNYNAILLRNLFKKMHNVRWYNDKAIKKGDRGIDLIDGCDYKSRELGEFHSIDFFEDILNGNRLFYKKGNNHFLITDFGRENGVYYTIEERVDSFGYSFNEPKVKVYHYFDYKSNHIPSTELRNDLHTIDSLFELHTVLGGIYCESLNQEGLLQYSEASNNAVANFVNAVSYKKDSTKKSRELIVDLTNYYQPLKDKLIDIVANNSAVKNGAGNLNKSSVYYDDNELSYMVIDTSLYGILMDADHTADEGKMTEFSQVISSLDAGGKLHDYVSQVYQALGDVTILLSKIELDAVEAFRNGEGKSKLYDIIGRTIINNLAKNRGKAGLADIILTNIKKEFNLNTDHVLDNIKIPFSDPNIYSNILPTVVSIINKKSIKRQYPGLGTVMAPGYDMSMIYEIDGEPYLFEDLLNLAIEKGYTSEFLDISKYNREIVSNYLIDLLHLQLSFTTTEIFKPTDNVLITFNAEIFNISALNTNEVEYEIVREPWAEDINKEDTDITKRYKDVLKIYIKGKRDLGSFDLVKDLEVGYYSIHFKTGDADTGKTFGSTPEQRNILYENLYRVIPEGAMVSTWGSVSLGGIKALSKLMDEYLGDIEVDNIVSTREVKDREGNTILIPIFKKFGTGMFDYNTLQEVHISLNDVYDYYSFKNNPIEYLRNKGYFNITNINYLKDITIPRNLAPARISWTIDINGDTHYMNIFDHWRIKSLILLSQGKSKKLINKLRKKFNPLLAFDEISKGLYVDLNGNLYKIDNLLNQAAELIMSNIYKTKFGLKDTDSLAYIRSLGEMYFYKNAELISSSNYDMAFTKLNGKHLYLTFKPIYENTDTFESYHLNWENTIRKEVNDGNIINEVYATTSDNIELFKVGREILREDLKFDVNGRVIDKEGNIVKQLKKYRRYGKDKVLEYIEFLSKYNILEEIDGISNKYTVYNINRGAIKRVFNKKLYDKKDLTRTKDGIEFLITPKLKFEEEINDFISRSLLAKIYESSDFNGVLLNSKVTYESHNVIEHCLHRFGKALSYNLELSNYISEKLLNSIKEHHELKKNIVTYKRLKGILREYRLNIAKKLYASFLKSLNFTASRIPALTLLSFMQMKCVGFTGLVNNQCFVSHWLAYLLGSKLIKN